MEGRPAVLGNRGKTGKNGRKEQPLLSARGAASSLLPGESPTFVRQWSNGKDARNRTDLTWVATTHITNLPRPYGKGRFRKRPFFYIW